MADLEEEGILRIPLRKLFEGAAMYPRNLLSVSLVFVFSRRQPTSAIGHQARWRTAFPDCARGRASPPST
jgi:hypothetical protein